MRSVINFFSLLAFGLMGAAGLVVGAPIVNESWSALATELPTLDYLSVAVGLCLGLSMGVLGQVSWSGSPAMLRIGWAGICVAWHSWLWRRRLSPPCFPTEPAQRTLIEQTARELLPGRSNFSAMLSVC